MNAHYRSSFYPMHLALLTVGQNLMPVAWWTPISKDPFRFLIAMDMRNHSLELLRTHGEAALHFMPWQDRKRVVRAGYQTGAEINKAAALHFRLAPASKLKTTRRIEGALSTFELTVAQELGGMSGDHVPFVMDVVHVHTQERPSSAEPILFLGHRDFATVGDRFRFKP
jgi:flavin reductase (DIM6/NTAB) family NADH-FMN oxidoreductase RutF